MESTHDVQYRCFKYRQRHASRALPDKRLPYFLDRAPFPQNPHVQAPKRTLSSPNPANERRGTKSWLSALTTTFIPLSRRRNLQWLRANHKCVKHERAFAQHNKNPLNYIFEVYRQNIKQIFETDEKVQVESRNQFVLNANAQSALFFAHGRLFGSKRKSFLTQKVLKAKLYPHEAE